jgi:hypothetical protein
MQSIARALRIELTRQFKSVTLALQDNEIAIPMSAGVDSHCALFAALHSGVRPVIFSFHLKGIDSRDYLIARSTAKLFGLKFISVELPNSSETLCKDVVKLAKFGCRSKTDFECFWPMTYLIRKMSQHGIRAFFTGHGADSLYCMSRKANQHYSGRWDEFRTQAFSSPKAFQRGLILKLCKEYGISYYPIFYNQRVLKLFLGSGHDDLHKPIQKAPSRFAFKTYFDQCKVYTHTSFQLGDSGIAEHFNLLLSSSLNTGHYKSVKGIYNSLVRKFASSNKE